MKMSDWRGPVGKELLRSLAIVSIIVAFGIFIVGIYVVNREDIWRYFGHSALFCILWLGLLVWLAWQRDRNIWSSVFTWYDKEYNAVLKALREALDLPAGQEDPQGAATFHVGDAIVVVKQGRHLTTVYIGPVDMAEDVERLTALVEATLGRGRHHLKGL